MSDIKRWYAKPLVWVIVAVLVIVGGVGVWALVGHNSRQALNARYVEVSDELIVNTALMVDGSAALLGIAEDHELPESAQESVDTIVEDSGRLLDGLVDDGLVTVDGFMDLTATDPGLYLSGITGDEESQSADGGQSEDAQSGDSHTIDVDFPVMVKELGYEANSAANEEAQSGPQSDSGAQSSEIAQSGDTGTWSVHSVALDGQATTSDIEGLEQRLGAVQAQNGIIEALAVELVTGTYDELLTAAQEGYDAQSTALGEALAKAEKVLKDSDKKVADNKTREALTKAIDAAKPIAAETADTVLVSELSAATAEKKDATDSLNKAIKAVTDSQAAKKKADEEAAAAEAEAARQAANSYVEPSYNGGNDYGYSGGGDYGYSNDYSGGGYSNGGGGGYQAPAPAPAPSNGGGNGGYNWENSPKPGGTGVNDPSRGQYCAELAAAGGACVA